MRCCNKSAVAYCSIIRKAQGLRIDQGVALYSTLPWPKACKLLSRSAICNTLCKFTTVLPINISVLLHSSLLFWCHKTRLAPRSPNSLLKRDLP